MYYVKVSMRLSWGFAVRELVSSKTRESYLVPPPTTLIGALAYGYARLHKLPEEDPQHPGLSSAERIKSIVVSVNERVTAPLVHYADISKIWWYRSREAAAKYDAVALGKVYRGVSRGESDLEVIYVVRDQDHAKITAASAHSLIRIGGSHGLASVEDIEYGPLSCTQDPEARTRFSFWEDLVVMIYNGIEREDLLVQEVVDFRRTPIGGYSAAPLRRRVYPYSRAMMTPLEIQVRVDSGRAMVCRGGGEEIIVER